jgi:hypothetical protein|tara:strand:- start:19 stop:2094 length:2076 start_codon:yes stop_codon:yes gene_type:complete
MRKIKISLCDLANDLNGIDNKSIPIGVGYITAYCKKIHGDSIKIKVFRTFRQFWEDALKQPPDIVGFGSYDWNYNLTLTTIKKLKGLNKDCLIAFGGANAEINMEDNKVFLAKHPNIDYIIYGDGEKPFSNIIENYKKLGLCKDWRLKLKSTPINGCRTLLDGKLIHGQPFDAVMDLMEIPSPYLTGVFDELLQNPVLTPIIQNIRGCPYKCRFCVSGTQLGKIRNFSLERVKEEITFLRHNAKNKILRFSDDNFGIIKHDLEVAKYIRECFDAYQYPAALKVYSAKKQNDRTREVGLILKPLMTYVVSFQTTTPDVLKETTRISATHKEATESINFARKNGMSTATELIFGLPGETLESWKEVINNTLNYGFDSVGMIPLWLLKGSDLNTPSSRETNQYVGKFMVGENAVTEYDDFISVERDEIAVQSKYYTYEEWKTVLKYQINLLMATFYGYGKEILYYANSINIKFTRLFDHILNNPKNYPIVNELVESYIKSYEDNMFDTEEELYSFINDNIEKFKKDKEYLIRLGQKRGLLAYIVKYILNDPENKYLNELRNAICEIDPREEVKEDLGIIFNLALKLIINPFDKVFVPDIELETKYNFKNWILEGYSKGLNFYKFDRPQKITLKCRNSYTVNETIKKDKQEKRTDCFNFFRYMNSGLMRRYIDAKDDNALINSSSFSLGSLNYLE